MVRALLPLLFFFAIIGCKDKPAEDVVANPVAVVPSFDWLVGDWERTNGAEEGQQTYEQWQKKSTLYYEGIGYTMEDTDTVWKENIVLFENDQDWYFSVKGSNDTTETNFLLTDINENYFKCQNVVNPFPKIIEYKSVENGLEAKISGGGEGITFNFIQY